MTSGERILALLPCPSRVLRKKVGIARVTLHKWLTRLRKAGQIHIGKWRRSVGDFVPIWTAGPGPDVERPVRFTPAQITANYRKRKKKAEAKAAQERAEAVQLATANARYANDPLLAAFFKST